MQLFHVGFAVADLETAMSELADQLGISWRPVLEGSFAMREASGAVRDMTMRFAYSTGGVPAVEVLQAVPGSPFEASANGFHHLGYWVDDLSRESRRLASQGWPCQATVADGGEPSRFAIHCTPLGFDVELLDQWFDRPWMRDLSPPVAREWHDT